MDSPREQSTPSSSHVPYKLCSGAPDLHGLCAWIVLFCCSQIFEQESPHCRFPLVPANYVMSDVFNLTSVNVLDRSQLAKANQFTFSLNFIFLVSSGISLLLLFFSESPAPQFSFFWIIPYNLHLTRLLFVLLYDPTFSSYCPNFQFSFTPKLEEIAIPVSPLDHSPCLLDLL